MKKNGAKKMNDYKFGAFILSHGRPDNVITYDTLRRHGYTGDIYIVIDNEDNTADEYKKNFKNVIMFDKKDIAERYDTGDNQAERRTVFFARNACFEIAKNLGLDYFIELDDDYTTFSYRVEKNNQLIQRSTTKLDRIFELLIEYLDKTKAKTVALAQGGDFIGGLNSNTWKYQLKRKAMNSFICRTDNPFEFVGRINEDVNTYVLGGLRGELFLTIANVMLNQKITQQSKGGMTEVYLNSGTYLKTFYSVMYAPSCVRIAKMGNTHETMRIHHKILWDNCTSMIINQKYKKI